jgi:hypothetical protein
VTLGRRSPRDFKSLREDESRHAFEMPGRTMSLKTDDAFSGNSRNLMADFSPPRHRLAGSS